MRILFILLILVGGAMLYVRLAPTPAERWHSRIAAPQTSEQQEASSFTAVRRISAPAGEVIKAFEQRALATPRTSLLAGSVEEGHLTFVTRSRLWGFPDVTTVMVAGDRLLVSGRARFGGWDWGVNKARVLEWLDSLGPLTEPL